MSETTERQPVCTCGHTKSWHPRRHGIVACRRFGCPCEAFVEKPMKEVAWEPE